MSESVRKLACNMYKWLTSQHERKVATGEQEMTARSQLFFSYRHFTYNTSCKVCNLYQTTIVIYIHYIMCSFCVLYAGLFYLLPDFPASHRFTFRGINRAPLSRHACHTSPVGEAIHAWAPFSWTASWLNGACSNSQPLDPPHTVFVSWTRGSFVLRRIIWWRRKCK